jgi:hypothetical protein
VCTAPSCRYVLQLFEAGRILSTAGSSPDPTVDIDEWVASLREDGNHGDPLLVRPRTLRRRRWPPMGIGRVVIRTSSGPTNVAIHRLSVAIELGDATDALRLGGAMDTSPIPPGGADRHAWVHLDLARAYDMKRQDEAALHRLLEAERIAPELTRNHAMAREMVGAMLQRREGRSTTPGLRELADRVGILN